MHGRCTEGAWKVHRRCAKGAQRCMEVHGRCAEGARKVMGTKKSGFHVN